VCTSWKVVEIDTDSEPEAQAQGEEAYLYKFVGDTYLVIRCLLIVAAGQYDLSPFATLIHFGGRSVAILESVCKP
jgi:hypothetical protein